MGSPLEKYYLFRNTAFLSLFTMKFIRYTDIRQNKQPTQYIANFRYVSEVSDIRQITL